MIKSSTESMLSFKSVIAWTIDSFVRPRLVNRDNPIAILLDRLVSKKVLKGIL